MRSQTGLGPDTLTWKYFGDWRGMLQGLWAGSMQNMHPGLGAAVEQHSTFYTERWQRLLRSLYPIGGVVFDGERAAETGARIRKYHNDIEGVDAQGRKYHALDPDTFYWAHATFFMGTILTAEHFVGGLTEADKRQLFDEHVTWYSLYGMSMRPVPESWEAFQEYWEHMCGAVLEDTKAARDVLDLSTLAVPPVISWLPVPVWSVIRRPIQRSAVRMTVGLYDQSVRDLLGYTWTERDEVWFQRVCRLVRAVGRLVPKRRLLHPRARGAYDRVSGRAAPLAETPDRNLPPPDKRNSPRHYVPGR
ncbi:hypothetical protein GCM10007304_06070 [Rhodococcoides trifolii]|uniref:ER-bound oxygenase mpaB/mpaB'/Rubber oxygenase catalytic domain-containing protein n=1 Tax=Rhodococcoides trifolii TaxID=908250 RepID=A0A917CRL7_9NOCA|nr:oxygenase MpaB family protein [Rhodococcus trifolii]GGF95000.1 hypothetical protein GCM10007304_06070 [Rhodococcus trifolii]